MQLIDIATNSRKRFFFFIDKCNEAYRSGHDLAIYREIIGMHREYGNLDTLLKKNEFLQAIYRTLEEWDMNRRGAKLTTFENLRFSVLFFKNSFIKLYEYRLYDDLYDEIETIKRLVEKIFCNIKVMETKRRIVGVSKALHFLLPDLILPIDSKYTMEAFYGYNKYTNSAKKEFKDFWDILERSYRITKRLELGPKDVDGELWNVSVPKLIDNSIIGLLKCKEEDFVTD